MTPEPPERYIYRLDDLNRITYVSPEWVRFARENDAPELTEEFVLGKPVEDFITGVETRELYEALFHNLRRRQTEIMIPFRCDSPTVIRQMNLTLRPLANQGIECEGTLLHAQEREPITILFRWVQRHDELIPICSLCRRLELHGEWVDAHEAVVQRRLFSIAPLPRLSETICPECKSVMA